MDALRYPIGKFTPPSTFTAIEIEDWTEHIASFPELLMSETNGLTPEMLEWKYRPGGWTIRQVVHHCCDSHINSQMRFKLALTEERPTIKPYEEALWAELSDIQTPINWSLGLLKNLHQKWVYLLEHLTEEELEKEYFHPEQQRYINLGQTIALYAWHCRHHLAHVRQAKEAQGKY